MKRIALSISLITLSLSAFSQDYAGASAESAQPVRPMEANLGAEHMKFRGEYVSGPLDLFCEKMARKGFAYEVPEPNGASLIGTFAGYPECHLIVSTNNHKVNKVEVHFPRRHVWSELAYDYYSLKEMLIKKYGEPKDTLEEFISHEPKDDYTKLMKVKQHLCTFYVKFELPGGEITLSLSKASRYNPCVILTYEDAINSRKEETKAYEDL
ncbi:MAG: hypothetical protein IJU72_01395 [Bacteroidales bacterium]|nr:hypothetical protein [Bacteroidales bacterium]